MEIRELGGVIPAEFADASRRDRGVVRWTVIMVQ